jgi:hypothetical protein
MKALHRSLFLASCAAILISAAAPSLAQSTPQMLETAKNACIEKAAAEGYDPKQAEVISSKAVDANTVEVVLNLTKDGSNFARLTCPYSAEKGVISLGENVVTKPNLSRLWWLLLPLLAIPLLLWFLRPRNRRDYVAADRVSTERPREYVAADRVQSQNYTEAYVKTSGEMLEVKEYPNATSRVVRRLSHDEHVNLTGQQNQGWVELSGGGWVPSRFLRFSDLPRTYS